MNKKYIDMMRKANIPVYDKKKKDQIRVKEMNELDRQIDHNLREERHSKIRKIDEHATRLKKDFNKGYKEFNHHIGSRSESKKKKSSIHGLW